MKIIIEIGKDELIHPQMAAAIAAQLESQVNDGAIHTVPCDEGPKLIPFEQPSTAPNEDSETTEDPNQMELPEQEEIKEESTYTHEDLKQMALTIAREHKSSKPVLDMLEEATGIRQLFENDTAHHTAIGKLFTIAIKAFT